MKKLIISLALAIGSLGAFADNSCQMPITVEVSAQDGMLTEANVNLLANKLTQVVSTAGFGGGDAATLCLTASVSETQKDVISGTRPTVAASYDVYLVIYNMLTGDKYGATSLSIKGSGQSEARCVQAAIAQINTANADLMGFVRTAHDKLFDYYNGHLPAIIQKAKVLAGREDFESALALLYEVPECVNNYDTVGDEMVAIWLRYVDLDCKRKLAQAKAIWATGKDAENARAAAAYLAAIHPDSGCQDDAKTLMAEIEKYLDDETARKLAKEADELAYQRQNEQFEMELRRYQLDMARELSMAYIQAMVEIKKSEAAAAGQQPQPVAPNNGNNPTSPVIIVK